MRDSASPSQREHVFGLFFTRCSASQLEWLVAVAMTIALLTSTGSAQEPAPNSAALENEFQPYGGLITRIPLPTSSVELRYYFERVGERQDAGSSTTHVHQLSLTVSYAPTGWLGVSATLPYQFGLTREPSGGLSSVNNVGDLSSEVLVTFFRDDARQIAFAGGVDTGYPTGSIHDGTGGQWSLTPFLVVGKIVGPVQAMADINFQNDFRATPDGGTPARELLYDVAVGTPLLDGRVFPLLELNGAYAFTGVPSIRHQGQLYLSPGVFVSPGGWFFPRPGSHSSVEEARPKMPWWERVTVGIGGHFPVTRARPFEWALTTSLTFDF